MTERKRPEITINIKQKGWETKAIREIIFDNNQKLSLAVFFQWGGYMRLKSTNRVTKLVVESMW